MNTQKSVLIVGSGPGLSTSLGQLFKNEGMNIAVAARNIKKLKPLASDINALCIECDAADSNQVRAMFKQFDNKIGTPSTLIYNTFAQIRGSTKTLDPNATKSAIDTRCYGAFLVAQQAAIRILAHGSGSIFFAGASAGLKGFANSSVFAMGKFRLRGLAQSLAQKIYISVIL